jgi:hypothetical protein
MLVCLLTDLNITSLTAPSKAGPFAFKGVAENQKSEGAGSNPGDGWNVLSYCEIYSEFMNSTGGAGLNFSNGDRSFRSGH